MPSFDIVCEIDLQEVDNAINQVTKDIATRYDFRGGKSTVSYTKAPALIQIVADDDFKMRAIHQILEQKLVKRGIDLRALDYGKVQEASGSILKQDITLKQGIEKDQAKKITKAIKDTKLKVQAQVQDDQVRVTGKKIDDLQAVISSLKSMNLDVPLQFVNMRS